VTVNIFSCVAALAKRLLVQVEFRVCSVSPSIRRSVGNKRTADSIKIPFWLVGRVSQWIHVLDGGPGLPTGTDRFLGNGTAQCSV